MVDRSSSSSDDDRANNQRNKRRRFRRFLGNVRGVVQPDNSSSSESTESSRNSNTSEGTNTSEGPSPAGTSGDEDHFDQILDVPPSPDTNDENANDDGVPEPPEPAHLADAILPPEQDILHPPPVDDVGVVNFIQPIANHQGDDIINDAIHSDSSGNLSQLSSPSTSEAESELSDGDSDHESDRQSSDEEEVEEGAEQNNEDIPLFNGAPLSLAQSLLAILTFSMVHNLTGIAVTSLLNLIALHCPTPNSCINSLFKFKSYFAEIGRKTLVYHFFCSECFSSLQAKDELCAQCERQTESSFFIEIPLLSQLQRMFQRAGFFADLQYRFNRRKIHENNIEDIYDGELYQNELNNGDRFLNNRNNISFMLYWDGLSIYKSSKLQIWPLCLVINELSYSKRTLKENIILAGLWFGPTKPKTNLFLRPFHACLSEFQNNGYMLHIPGNREPILVKGKVLCATCDLPARAKLMGMKMYNGFYGCCTCKSRGERVPVGNTTVQTHPYIPPEAMQLRDNQEVPRFCEIAEQHGGSYYGFMFISYAYLILVDLIKGMAIDIMHCVFLGIMKVLAKLWFDKSMAQMPYSVYRLIDIVDEKLLKIKPPSSVQRAPRSIKSDLKLWKASEYKNFFFYYSIPVLQGILEPQYLHHHMKLVSAIYLLSQKSIFPEQLLESERLLNSYVSDFGELYGNRYMSMNIHMLLHIPRVVRLLGPLWVYSCFFLEDLNGGLARLVHGTRYPGVQICSSATLYMSLSTMISELPALSPVKKYCETENETNYSSIIKIAENITLNRSMQAVGLYEFPCHLPDDILLALRRKLGLQDRNDRNDHFQGFYRLKRKGSVIFSELYGRLSKRVSTVVSVKANVQNKQLCRIVKFVRWSSCDCQTVCYCLPARFLCVGRLYNREPWLVHGIPNIRLGYMSKVHETNNIIVVDLRDLDELCFYVKIDDENEYICEPVSSFEKE